MENPYFDEVAPHVSVGPNRTKCSDGAIDLLCRERDYLVRKYAWAIPNEEAIDVIVQESPVLEVGAGTGYWASLVREKGGTIVATDPEPGTHHPDTGFTYTEVVEMEAERAVTDLVDDVALMICWPDHGKQWPLAAVETYRLGNSTNRTVIYVGEGRGGCTGSDEFHWELYEHWTLSNVVYLPNYFGINDRLEVWRR